MARHKRGILRNLLFFINTIFALMLLLAYLLPYIPPKSFPLLSVLSLGMPLLIIVNSIFLIYWTIRLKRELILPLIVLAIGFNHVLSLYKFTAEKDITLQNDISVMSYNVRQFNRYRWIKNDTVTEQIQEFIKSESPDILCFQEYYSGGKIQFPEYSHKYIKDKSKHSGQAIFSKFPILKTGSLDFPHTANNVIYADILVVTDTIRIYNIHLESLKIDPTIGTFEAEHGKRLFKRMSLAFQTQQDQVDLVLKELGGTSYKTIICGDMNNSAFSYAYRKLSTGFQDAFKEAGHGFGRTYDIDWIPLRIDVLLVDDNFMIESFKNYHQIELSDHFPIMTRLKLKD